MRFRYYFPRLVLLFFSTAIALGFGELWCRFSFKKNLENIKITDSDIYYYFDSNRIKHLIPSKTGHEVAWDDPNKRMDLRINSLGYRGKETTLDKPAGMFRIFFLGDSITIGARVEVDQIFTSRLDQFLQARGEGRYEVINGGVPDVGLTEEEYYLKNNGIRLQPNLVIIWTYLNDGRPTIGFPEEFVYKNPVMGWFHHQSWLKKSYLAGAVYNALRNSLVTRQLKVMQFKDQRSNYFEVMDQNKWVADPAVFNQLIQEARFDWGSAWNPETMKSICSKLDELRDFAAAHNARLIDVMTPVRPQVDTKLRDPLIDQPQRELAAHCKAAGIPFLDLLPAFRKVGGQALYYDWAHYTPTGHAVAADALIKFLTANHEVKVRG